MKKYLLLLCLGLVVPALDAQTCTNMTNMVSGNVRVGTDGFVIAHLTNNSNQTVLVSYAFKVNGRLTAPMQEKPRFGRVRQSAAKARDCGRPAQTRPPQRSIGGQFCSLTATQTSGVATTVVPPS